MIFIIVHGIIDDRVAIPTTYFSFLSTHQIASFHPFLLLSIFTNRTSRVSFLVLFNTFTARSTENRSPSLIIVDRHPPSHQPASPSRPRLPLSSALSCNCQPRPSACRTRPSRTRPPWPGTQRCSGVTSPDGSHRRLASARGRIRYG